MNYYQEGHKHWEVGMQCNKPVSTQLFDYCFWFFVFRCWDRARVVPHSQLTVFLVIHTFANLSRQSSHQSVKESLQSNTCSWAFWRHWSTQCSGVFLVSLHTWVLASTALFCTCWKYWSWKYCFNCYQDRFARKAALNGEALPPDADTSNIVRTMLEEVWFYHHPSEVSRWQCEILHTDSTRWI